MNEDQGLIENREIDFFFFPYNFMAIHVSSSMIMMMSSSLLLQETSQKKKQNSNNARFRVYIIQAGAHLSISRSFQAI